MPLIKLSPLQEIQRGNKWSRGELHSPTLFNKEHDFKIKELQDAINSAESLAGDSAGK